MKKTEFDKRFDEGKDITSLLDLSTASRPGLEVRRINVDFPTWMIEAMDKEADRLGITRQSLIKFWLAEKLKQAAV